MRLKFYQDVLKQSRLPWIDYARGIAIILVVYRHIFEGFSRALDGVDQYAYLEHANIIFYSFRMPLFFILSGIFIGKSLQKRSVQQIIINKFNILLWPYLIWATLQVSLQFLVSHYVNINATRSWIDYMYIALYPRQIDQFWYLYALFNVTVLYVMVRQLAKVKIGWQLAIGLVTFFISSYLSTHKIDLGFIYDILHYYIFFAIGDLVSKYMLDKSMYPKFSSWQAFLVLLPIFVIGQYYFLETNLAHGDYTYVEAYEPILFMLIATSGCIFMFNISFILQRWDIFKALRVVGYHSLYIYVSHVLVASATRVLLVKLGLTYVPLMLAICLFISILVPIGIYYVALKLGAWWLYSLERPSESKIVTPKPQIAG
ncbi:hypothetical protein COR50_15495 [Chitinophaga caeni]|uniref:Acyltransferase 3 domain-containing protein n=1 Tax=Chitinophaga caeni TaxID=2029983 RepID=A0A291QX63_9BACT|nr:acyltransferase [Chitinophaga caeni]ATL48453.1 hypothetical protein COR50_15495 [Chitinophaga caeni]